MKPEQIVDEIEGVLTRMGIRVRREKGNFKGGWCVINDERCLVINKRHSPEIQFSVIAECVRTLPHESIYLRPGVREALEEQWMGRPVDVTSDFEEDG
ncbi:MAG: hypothetical protein WBW88_18095 [Rhodothermales bacterium]